MFAFGGEFWGEILNGVVQRRKASLLLVSDLELGGLDFGLCQVTNFNNHLRDSRLIALHRTFLRSDGFVSLWQVKRAELEYCYVGHEQPDPRSRNGLGHQLSAQTRNIFQERA
jgi:hypothetical protein